MKLMFKYAKYHYEDRTTDAGRFYRSLWCK